MPKGVYPRRAVVERFESQVDRSGDCHLWTGALNSEGYANFWVDRHYVGAHVFAFERVHGPTPVGLCIRHTHSGNRHCVNPDHLLIGTKGDNNRDRQTQGTQTYGSAHHAAVLTERDVIVANRLHKLGVPWNVIGRRLGKSPSTIANAVMHRRGVWSHVKTEYS